MSVSMKSTIVVGLPYGELSEINIEKCENEGMDQISPYYDSDTNDALIGYVVLKTGEYYYKQIVIDMDFLNSISEAKIKFKLITGMDAQLFLSPFVY